MEMLTNLTMVEVAQYIHVLNQYLVHFELAYAICQLYLNKAGGRGEVPLLPSLLISNPLNTQSRQH